MPRALWTQVAESDLDEILFYIAFIDRNPATGERIYGEIRDCVTNYAEKSHTGHRHPDAPLGWLYVRHMRWLIFYRPHPEGIEIMRVVDAIRDLPRQLRGS